MRFDSARADAELAGDLFAALAGNQELRDFALAGGEFDDDRALFGDVLEHPDGAGEGFVAGHGAAGNMAPEQPAALVAHDALVAVAAGFAHALVAALADVFEFLLGGVERGQRMADQLVAAIAEHRGEGFVAVLDDAVARYAQADRCQIEGQPQVFQPLFFIVAQRQFIPFLPSSFPVRRAFFRRPPIMVR